MDVGFYGKLPSHGDFLRRRVSASFVDVWDAWLQQGLAASRTSLGERWLEVYLTSPVWRFVGAPGSCGPAPILGLMAPSVDRVGRYFPVTLVAELPADVTPIAAALETTAFFERAERLVVETLAAEQVDFESFDARVVALRDELGGLAAPRPVVLDVATAGAIVNDGGTPAWQVPLGAAAHLGSILEQLLALRLSAVYDPLMVWWTEGSSVVEPSGLITSGLPAPDTFPALLDGSWGQHQWCSVSARIEPAVVEMPLDAPPLRVRSAAGTNVGKVRSINQDAFLERPEVGLWAVADGLGGHRSGEVASRMVCDALADFDPVSSFEDMLEGAHQRMLEVNAHLLRTAPHALSERSLSTVAILLVRGESCAILWAGDSRVYRWRGGRLERLTRDHSVAESDRHGSHQDSHVVTRAIGVDPNLMLDLHRDDVRAGDRFLLCSDGLTHVLPDARIGGWMENPDIRAAVDGLIQATLDAGAPDNVTALIVQAEG